MTIERLPLLVVGVTDGNNKFHFSGLTLANHEAADDYAFTFRSLQSGIRSVTGIHFQPTVLVCDADTAIHNGFKRVFFSKTDEDPSMGCLIIMCYFHVMLNIQKKYKFAVKGNKKLFKADVRNLHLCCNENQFDIGCALFVQKWHSVEYEATRLLQKSFFENHKNWYIGCAARVPKSNNSLESFNSSLKRCQTEHRRQPLKQFLQTALSIVRQRSMEYLQDKPTYEPELQITDDLFERGRRLRQTFVYREMPNGAVEFRLFRSDVERKITLADVSTFEKATYDSFDDFVAGYFQIWTVLFPPESSNWQQATCSCPAFDREFMCKHIIHIAYNIGILDLPAPDFYDEPLFHTKRGRPKRTTAALVME